MKPRHCVGRVLICEHQRAESAAPFARCSVIAPPADPLVFYGQSPRRLRRVAFILTSNMPGLYREEVLGRHCSILFEREDTQTIEPYPGRVTKYKAILKDNGDITGKHYIVFEDGDKLWRNLEIEAQEGRLKWLHRGLARPEESAPRSEPDPAPASSVVAAHRIKQEEEEEEEDQDDSDSETESDTEEEEYSGSYRERKPSSTNKPVVVTPPKKKRKTAKQRPPNVALTPEQAKRLEIAKSWLDEMTFWLKHTPHGPSQKVVSAANANCVMRQVKKLVSGQGVSYTRWPADVVFYKDRPVNLQTTNFENMVQEAKAHEARYGQDLGHGWLLTHPIKKLHLFQQHREEHA